MGVRGGEAEHYAREPMPKWARAHGAGIEDRAASAVTLPAKKANERERSEPARTERGLRGPASERVGGFAGAKPPEEEMTRDKTILIAHRHADIRDRFAAALADARHGYVTADTEAAARDAAADHEVPISLALIDLGLAQDGVGFVRALRQRAGRTFPVVVFAGTVDSADQVRALLALHVAGYVNEHAATPQILPALAPHLFPDNFNRRASPRVVLGVPVSYRSGRTIAGALTLNIGKGGLAIRTMTPLPPDTSVRVKFRLPAAGQDIEGDGRVAWSDRKVGMGIQFEEIDPADQAEIDAFADKGTA